MAGEVEGNEHQVINCAASGPEVLCHCLQGTVSDIRPVAIQSLSWSLATGAEVLEGLGSSVSDPKKGRINLLLFYDQDLSQKSLLYPTYESWSNFSFLVKFIKQSL